MKGVLSKKKILIVMAAIIVVALGTLVYYFVIRDISQTIIPQTINGEWEMIINPETTDSASEKINDSQKVYYTFSEPGKYGDGKYKTIFDGGIEEGEYKLSEKDGKSYINMGTIDLEYKIVDSKLTITYPNDSDDQTGEDTPVGDYVFIKAKAPEYEKESYEYFETDNALLAEWVTKERTLSYYANELSYTETVEFLENGVMIIKYYSKDLMLDRDMYYAYTVKDNDLLFSLVTDKETQYKVSYALDKDGNLKFVNDETTSSIFADAFFSDVTYYHINS